MAEANNEKYDISNILNIPSHLKCVACKMMLKNAHQVQCACRYCRRCVDELLTSECYYCIGNKPRCRETNLNDAQIDYYANDEISHVIVKCHQNACSFECELVDMCDHARLCDQGNVKCPFYGQGCCDDKMKSDQIEQHMQQNGYIHNRILLEMIDNNTNGVAVLVNNQEESSGKFESIENSLAMKETRIAFLTEEIRTGKEEIEAWKRSFEEKIDEIVSDMNSQSRDKTEEINFLKAENARLEDRLEKLEGRSVVEDLHGGTGEIAAGPEGGIRSTWVTQSYSRTPSTRPVGCTVCVAGNVFHWDISDVAAIARESEVYSGVFHATSGHKLALVVKHFNGDELWLSLCVWCDLDGPQWPFRAKVTMKVLNKANPTTFKQTTKPIFIDRRLTSFVLSDPFYFTYSDLTDTGVVLGNSFTVECSLE